MSTEMLVYIFAVYLLAGTVKGVVGLGLPTVSLALLAGVLGLKEAMVLLLFPSVATNIWQAFSGGRLLEILRRTWPMYITLCIGVWFASGVMLKTDVRLLTLLLGGLLISYAAISLVTPQIPEPGRRNEVWLAPVSGILTGIGTGFTGVFVMPGILYLQALRLGKDGLVQALGISFTVATCALGFSLGGRGEVPVDLALISALSIAPAFVGMWLGRKVRNRLPELVFRRVLFIALLLLGMWIAARAIFLMG